MSSLRGSGQKGTAKLWKRFSRTIPEAASTLCGLWFPSMMKSSTMTKSSKSWPVLMAPDVAPPNASSTPNSWSATQAELVFRHKVFRLLRDRELITQQPIDLLLSWRHSGFGVHNHTTVYPSDIEGLHKLVCYLMRSPVNLSRLRYHPQSQLILYEPKAGHDADELARLDPLEFLARVLIRVPEPNKHLVLFYGAYAIRVRSSYRPQGPPSDQATEPTPSRRALSKTWRELTYRIFEIDPLTCPRRAGEMKPLAFITEHDTICRILDHRNKIAAEPRAPPTETPHS